MNRRVTPKERGLLKGAIRRVFARSDLRRKVLDAAIIEHKDPARPRVTKWVRCAVCKQPYPKYKSAVDHMDPVIPLDKSFEEIGLDATVNRTWSDEKNLQVICTPCHNAKTKEERKARKAMKKNKNV